MRVGDKEVGVVEVRLAVERGVRGFGYVGCGIVVRRLCSERREWCVDAAAMMSSIYDEHKDEDGFVYFTYSGENTFGGASGC